MKKFVSLILTVILLITMLSVFAVPVFAVPVFLADATAVLTKTGTCYVEMLKHVDTYIDFTPSVSDNYTFISDLSEDTPNTAKLLADLYCGRVNEPIISDLKCSEGNGNFCISYNFEAGKTYRLRIQLQGVDSGSADISVLKEVTPENIANITGNCIISKPGSYTCEQFIVNDNSTLIIGRNAAVKVTYYYSNHGKINLHGRLDLSQTPFYTIKGDINTGKVGTLIEPNAGSGSFDVSQFKEVIPEFKIDITGNCVINKPGNYEFDRFYVRKNSTLIIGRNVTIKANAIFTNEGKIELYGKLDCSQITGFSIKGNINIGEGGTLVEPNNGSWNDYSISSVFSDGSLWIIIAVAVVAVGGIAALVIVKKKKKKTAESVES